MEVIKIEISEVEGMTVKIPTEFTAYSFSKFYEQLLLIGKSMPNNHLISKSATPERLKSGNWKDKDECLEVLNIWDNQGREKTIEWIKERKGFELDAIEISKLSGLMCMFRAKYKKELQQ